MRNLALAASAILVLGYVVVGSTSCGSSGDDNIMPIDAGEAGDGLASGGSGGGGGTHHGGSGGHAGAGGSGGVMGSDGGDGPGMDAMDAAETLDGVGMDSPDAPYASLPPTKADRRHGIALASGDSTTIPLTWHDASGLAPPADLWVESNGKPVLQVSSVNGHPFVRAGLNVAPIEAGVAYRLVLARKGNTVNATLVHDLSPQGDVVLRTQVPVADKRLADNSPVAEVVLPATYWRSSVVTALP
jgi:hypothetical protein